MTAYFASDKNVDENLFRLLVASVKDYAIFLIDKDGFVLSWNQGAERIKGYTEDEIKGKNISLFYTREDQRNKAPAHMLEETLKKGVHETEGWRIRKDGSRFWANVVFTALYNDDHQLVGIAKVTRDITVQKLLADKKDTVNFELEQQIKKQAESLLGNELRFSKLLEYSYDGIVLINEELKVFYRSLTAEHITGWSNQDPVKNNLLGRVHPDDEEHIGNLLNNKVLKTPGVPFRTTLRSLHKDGHYIWLDAVYINHLNEPHINAIVCNIRDIGELKAMNETLEQKVKERTAQLEETNRELESFSYSVSHDLRTPLRAINGYAMMLKEDFTAVLNAEGNRILDTITNNARLMGTLIDDLLTFSRLGRKELVRHAVDMNGMVAAALRELDEQTDQCSITINTLPPCEADASMIKQVWLNLIGNAIKYSSKKSHPEIEIGALEAESTGKYHTYYITDNGVGFDMQYADKLFGVFQRLHRNDEFEGTGVGLALVKRIINRHGGKIWADAEPDKGATFYFTLPILI